MAYSTEITAINAGNPAIVDKVVYRGNVQAISVTIADATNGTYYVSSRLPDTCRVIGASIFVADLGTAFTVTVGDGTTANSIGALGSGNDAAEVAFPTTGSAAGYVDVGGETLQIVVADADNTANIVGYILIVTNE